MIPRVAGLSFVVVVYLGRSEALNSRTQTCIRILFRALRRLIEQNVETPIKQPAMIRRWGR